MYTTKKCYKCQLATADSYLASEVREAALRNGSGAELWM